MCEFKLLIQISDGEAVQLSLMSRLLFARYDKRISLVIRGGDSGLFEMRCERQGKHDNTHLTSVIKQHSFSAPSAAMLFLVSRRRPFYPVQIQQNRPRRGIPVARGAGPCQQGVPVDSPLVTGMMLTRNKLD